MEKTGYNRAPFPTDKNYGVQNHVRCIEHTERTESKDYTTTLTSNHIDPKLFKQGSEPMAVSQGPKFCPPPCTTQPPRIRHLRELLITPHPHPHALCGPGRCCRRGRSVWASFAGGRVFCGSLCQELSCRAAMRDSRVVELVGRQ